MIASVSAGSRNAEAGVVATSITACRALLAGPPIDVAAAENDAGMVTTAAYRPDCRPDAASSPFVSTQVKFVASASASASCVETSSFASAVGLAELASAAELASVAEFASPPEPVSPAASVALPPPMSPAANCRPSGTVWPFTVTGSSSLTIAAVTRSRCAVGVASAHVRMPPMSSGTASMPTTASHPR